MFLVCFDPGIKFGSISLRIDILLRHERILQIIEDYKYIVDNLNRYFNVREMRTGSFIFYPSFFKV